MSLLILYLRKYLGIFHDFTRQILREKKRLLGSKENIHSFTNHT